MQATKVLDMSEIVRLADEFKKRLDGVKSGIKDGNLHWYPYDSFSNVDVLNRMLKGRFRTLLSELSGALTLDIGSADGDFAFFLESLGFRVIAIDNPETDCSQMRGIRAVKAALSSRVEIVSADLDSRFELPEGPYDLVFFLGILYHLKNPYYMLDLLSRQCRFCFLSTRVARFTPDRVEIQNAPVAYLLDADELNHDCTNYWIFSEAGLKRMLHRTGWEICAYMTLGDTSSSDPNTLERDERAFCLVRSLRLADRNVGARLVKGWHQLEVDSWRWTERVFSVELPRPEQPSHSTLEMDFAYPDVLKQAVEKIRITGRVEDAPLQDREYLSAGPHYYRMQVPESLLSKATILAEFELNGAIPPDSIDLRERGIIVPNSAFRWTR